MTKILANDGLAPSGIEKLKANGFEVITEHVPQDQLIDAINSNNYAGLLVRSATKVREDLIDACPHLKFIGRGGVGMDNIDVEYARGKGLTVNNTPAASSQSVAELVMANLFSTTRSLYDSNRNMPTKGATEFKALKKKYGKGIELNGKTLGIIGFGRIGQSVAKYAIGCGMNVIANDKELCTKQIELNIANQTITADIKCIGLDELISESDYITIHVPKQKDGTAVIGAAEISKMKDGVCLVNSARGGVIDESALVAGLASGKIAHAALDVFENEPTPNPDLLKEERISLTPHIGAATLEAQDRIGTEMADNIIKCFSAIN